ncbi:MAG: type II CAAX endopeptidase family protein [Clostridia bacterium]|nr:type II CAAX endopeptidase family protein [Clostridia bacterium]
MEKRKYFTKLDSAFMFMCSIIIPQLAGVIIVMLLGLIMNIFGSNYANFSSSLFGELVLSSITSLVFIAILIFYSHYKKIDIKSATHLNKKINYINIFCGICIGITAVYLFSPLISMVDAFLINIGYTITGEIPILTGSAGTLILGILVLAILPSIAEELMFRGAILNGLKKHGVIKAVLISALCFMLMHTSPQQTVYQFILGIIFGYAVYSTGSIYMGMLIHFVNNLIVVINAQYSLTHSITAETFTFTASNIIIAILSLIVGTLIIWGIFKINNKLNKILIKNIKDDETIFNEQEKVSEITNISSEQINYLQRADSATTKKYWRIGFAVSIFLWFAVLISSLSYFS